MKKYKLKKDLPRAKTGSEVVLFPVKDNFEISRINLFQENWNNSRLGFICNEDISEWLEEIPQKPKSIWDLKDWDFCYVLRESWSITSTVYCSTNDTFAKIISNWNMFLSLEEAQKELEKRKAIGRIKKYCWENGIDMKYNNTSIHWCYRFLSDGVGLYLPREDLINGNPIWYFDKEWAEKVFENCLKDLEIFFDL